MTARKKTQKKTPEKKGGGALFLTVTLGAALAAAAGYYATHKEEVDKEAKKHMDQLAKAYKENRPMVEKRVREVWGDVSEEAIATYLDVRGAVLHSLEEENLEKTGKMIRKQYDQIVETVVKEARKSGVLNKDVEKKLEDLFKMDWKEISAILGSSAHKVAGVATKEVKKVVKDVKKKKAARKAPGKKTSAKKKPAPKRKPAAKKRAPARKTAAKKAPAKRKTAAKKPVRRTTKKKK